MKFLNTLAKLMAALAAVAAAAAVIYRLIERHNEKMDELDAYLMDDPDETVENQSLEPGDVEYLNQDFGEWNQIDHDQAVEVSFLTDPQQVEAFQQALAEHGCSSHYDPDSKILTTVLYGPKDRAEIEEFETVLKDALAKTNSTYLGYAFE